MNKPDYSSYTIGGLVEAKESIGRDAWPERFIEIENKIKSLTENDPATRDEYNELVFINFCESLRDDLTFTIDDNFFSLLGLFSKRAKKAIPSTFQGEVCPICSGELIITNNFFDWQLACKNCHVEGIVEERIRNS